MKEKTRKMLTGTAAMVLVAAISAGGTFAYLTHLTEKRANNFTFASEGIDAKLTEPEWDGADEYEEDSDGGIHPIYKVKDKKSGKTKKAYGYKDKNGNGTYDEDDELITTDKDIDEVDWDEVLPPDEVVVEEDGEEKEITPGWKQAQKMKSGDKAAKNPTITNTSEELSEWVAARVTFVYSEDAPAGKTPGQKMSAEDFDNYVLPVIQIDFPAGYLGDTTYSQTTKPANYASKGEWVYADVAPLVSAGSYQYPSSMVFYYDTLVEKDASTNPVFNVVTVSPEATTAQLKNLEAIGGFVIYVEGFAIQDSAYTNGFDFVKSNVASFASGNWEKAVEVGGNGITKASDIIEVEAPAAPVEPAE